MRVFSWFVLPQFGAELGAPALHRPIAESAPDEAWFWATHNSAELDLLLLAGGGGWASRSNAWTRPGALAR